MFDINDSFYQDICTPYNYKNNSDILLTDRIDYIYNNDDSQCQDNCKFSNYFSNSRYINCTCEIDKDISKETEKIDKFVPKNIYQSFYYVLKYSNYEILKCFKLVFNITALTKNKGSIITISFFAFYVGCLVYYIIKGISPLKHKMENFFGEKEEGRKDSMNNNILFPPGKKKKSSFKKTKMNSSKNLVYSKKVNKREISLFKNQNLIFNKKAKKSLSSKNIVNKEEDIAISNKSMLEKSKFQNEKIQGKFNLDINKKENKSKQLDDFELNELAFEEAIKKDNRKIFSNIFLFHKKRAYNHLYLFYLWRL